MMLILKYVLINTILNSHTTTLHTKVLVIIINVKYAHEKFTFMPLAE